MPSATSFAAALAKVAKLGFEGVEPAGGFRGMTPWPSSVAPSKTSACAWSEPTPLGVRQTASTRQSKPPTPSDWIDRWSGGGYGPDRFESTDAIAALADEVNSMTSRLSGTGKSLST